MDITELTVHELQEKIKNKELTITEITKAYVDRMNEKEKDVQAFITELKDEALKQSEEIQNKIDEVLNKVGMKAYIDKMPHQLSGGEQQRIAIARALLNNPEFILADEPTGNLDPQTSIEVLDVLKKINEAGKTVIMATHDYAMLMKFPAKTLKCEDSHIFEVVQKTV